MTRKRVSPRRSLRISTPPRGASRSKTQKTAANAPDSTSIAVPIGKTQRPREERTYARKRPRAEAAALLASRSATVSLDTRNCGGGRVSLGTKAVPLQSLLGEDDDESGTSSDEYTTSTSRRKNAGVRTRGGSRRAQGKDRNAAEEKEKLDEFMAQQRVFWKEVDDFDLVEEDGD